jgi:hypothetical protein
MACPSQIVNDPLDLSAALYAFQLVVLQRVLAPLGCGHATRLPARGVCFVQQSPSSPKRSSLITPSIPPSPVRPTARPASARVPPHHILRSGFTNRLSKNRSSRLLDQARRLLQMDFGPNQSVVEKRRPTAIQWMQKRAKRLIPPALQTARAPHNSHAVCAVSFTVASIGVRQV